MLVCNSRRILEQQSKEMIRRLRFSAGALAALHSGCSTYLSHQPLRAAGLSSWLYINFGLCRRPSNDQSCNGIDQKACC